jgi:hypothetical protein
MFLIFVYLSICLSVFLSICLSVYLSICLSVYLSICLSVYLSICLSVYLSICLSIYLSVYLSVYFSICLFLYLSISISVYLYICLSLYLSISLYVYLSIYLSLSNFKLCFCSDINIFITSLGTWKSVFKLYSQNRIKSALSFILRLRICGLERRRICIHQALSTFLPLQIRKTKSQAMLESDRFTFKNNFETFKWNILPYILNWRFSFTPIFYNIGNIKLTNNCLTRLLIICSLEDYLSLRLAVRLLRAVCRCVQTKEIDWLNVVTQRNPTFTGYMT